jgi:hypothetical protein
VKDLMARLADIAKDFEYKVLPNKEGGRTEHYTLTKLKIDSGVNDINTSETQTIHNLNKLKQLIASLPEDIKEAVFEDAECLCIFDSLKHITSTKWVQVKAVRATNIVKPVYDLHVPVAHHYSMEGIWGHNTIIGLVDIGGLIHAGKIKRPFVLCPNNLVKNWVEDLHKVSEGAWNVVPITTSTLNAWGDEGLTKMLNAAPINTIVVVGQSCLGLRRIPIVFGNHVDIISDVLEFIKKFGFDYIIIDEAHRCRKTTSYLHKAAKQLSVCETIKYVRLATGSIIHNRYPDICGQAAMFSSQIFRTAKEFESENSYVNKETGKTLWLDDTASRARNKLAQFSSLISFKRKEWAFLLPIPIEEFIQVNFKLTLEENSGKNDPAGEAHQAAYMAILEDELKAIKANPDIMKLIKGRAKADEDDEDDDDSDGNEDGKLNDDMDDDVLANLEAQLYPYLARLEQILTDPMGDPLGEIFFKKLGM